MTLKELRDNVAISRGNGYNCYKVEITYRDKQYTCTSNNSLAWDRLQDSNYLTENVVAQGYTEKQAYQAFYDECKRKNHLGEYSR